MEEQNIQNKFSKTALVEDKNIIEEEPELPKNTTGQIPKNMKLPLFKTISKRLKMETKKILDKYKEKNNLELKKNNNFEKIDDLDLKKERKHQNLIENARLARSYKKRKINQDICNIIRYEHNNIEKNKKVEKDIKTNKWDEMTECEKKINNIKYIEKENKILEINHLGSIQLIFNDGSIMSQLSDEFNVLKEKNKILNGENKI